MLRMRCLFHEMLRNVEEGKNTEYYEIIYVTKIFTINTYEIIYKLVKTHVFRNILLHSVDEVFTFRYIPILV